MKQSNQNNRFDGWRVSHEEQDIWAYATSACLHFQILAKYQKDSNTTPSSPQKKTSPCVQSQKRILKISSSDQQIEQLIEAVTSEKPSILKQSIQIKAFRNTSKNFRTYNEKSSCQSQQNFQSNSMYSLKATNHDFNFFPRQKQLKDQNKRNLNRKIMQKYKKINGKSELQAQNRMSVSTNAFCKKQNRNQAKIQHRSTVDSGRLYWIAHKTQEQKRKIAEHIKISSKRQKQLIQHCNENYLKQSSITLTKPSRKSVILCTKYPIYIVNQSKHISPYPSGLQHLI